MSGVSSDIQLSQKGSQLVKGLPVKWPVKLLLASWLDVDYIVEVSMFSYVLLCRRVSQTQLRSLSVILLEPAVLKNALTIYDRADSQTKEEQSSPLKTSLLNCCRTSMCVWSAQQFSYLCQGGYVIVVVCLSVSVSSQLVSWSLTSLLQHKYGYIRDESLLASLRKNF